MSSLEIRVPHDLGSKEAARRVRAVAAEHDVGNATDDETFAGSLAKETPLGAVRGRWRAEADAVVVTVDERPAFLPEGAVRRAVEGELAKALAP